MEAERKKCNECLHQHAGLCIGLLRGLSWPNSKLLCCCVLMRSVKWASCRGCFKSHRCQSPKHCLRPCLLHLSQKIVNSPNVPDLKLAAMPRQTAHYHFGNHVRSPLSTQAQNQHFLLEGAGGGTCIRHLDQSSVGQQQSAENS